MLLMLALEEVGLSSNFYELNTNTILKYHCEILAWNLVASGGGDSGSDMGVRTEASQMRIMDSEA